MNILFVYSTYSREKTRNSVVADDDYDDDDNNDDGEEEEETDTARISNKIVQWHRKTSIIHYETPQELKQTPLTGTCTCIFKLNYFVKPAQGSTVVTQVLFSVKCMYKND